MININSILGNIFKETSLERTNFEKLIISRIDLEKRINIESSKDKAKIKELEEEARERKNKSKKMSEYGKKARGKPKI